MTGKGIKFDKDKISSYFINSVLGYTDNGLKVDFSNEVVYDLNQQFWIQNEQRYVMTDEIDILNNFKNYFDEFDRHNIIKSGIRSMVLEAYRQFGREQFRKLRQIPENCIVFSNAIVYVGKKNPKEILEPATFADLDTIERGYVFWSFNYFITSPLSWEYKPNEEHSCPTIDKLFREWVIPRERWDNPTSDDLIKVKWLYEIIAWCMIPNYNLQRAIILNGSGKNGKSKGYIKLLEKIIGKDNCTATDIRTLTDTNFGTAQLYNKLVCTIAEVDGHKLEKTSILKSLTGGDNIPAQFKHKQYFTFSNYAKLIMSANTIPQTADKTDGFYRRFLIIDFPNKFSGDKDDILSDIPEPEYEALANICVGMLKDLVKRNKFTNEPSDEKKAEIYEQKSNPLQYFLYDNFEVTESIDDHIFCYEFYGLYIDWLKKNGYPSDISTRAIGIEMHDRGHISEKRTDYSKVDSPRYFAFIGIKKKDKTINPDKPPIEPEKEFTEQEIFDYYVNLGKMDKDHDIDQAIRILKKGTIYEPRNGVYKINNGDTNVVMD